MPGISFSNTPGTRVVVPFYLTGALFFLLLNVLLILSVKDLRGHHFSPHILALVHTAALGWGTMIIFGASYQLLPVICEKSLYSEGLAIMSWLLLVAGTLLLIFSFWTFNTGLILIAGGLLVWFSSLLYLWNVVCTSSGKNPGNISKYYLVSSAIWLLITVTIGVLLAVNLYYPYISEDHLEILKLHAHAGIAGWFLQLITGVSSRLIPMFLLGKSGKEKWLSLSFYFQNTGLILFLTDGYFSGINHRALWYAGIITIGVIFWLAFLYDAFKNRVKKKTDMPMKHTFISFASLISGLILIVPVFYLSATRWTMMYGFLLFGGWITGIILGKTFKTLPFIIWNKHYQSLHGKNAIPLPKDLYSANLVKVQFYSFAAAMILFLLAFITDMPYLFYAALVAWSVMTFLYLINTLGIIFHSNKYSYGN